MKYKSATQIWLMTEQQKCAQASLRISWILGKHMKPFTDADIVKECMLQSGNKLFKKNYENSNEYCYFYTCKIFTPAQTKMLVMNVYNFLTRKKLLMKKMRLISEILRRLWIV
ncbi:unnamed protein product [Macrosiphum euphorbiae]|uniref:LAGLIDADG homing endonuclease n=1 Tax=Macrosiphum euphorbiae TaxID=13131 RepID=A0AAV0VMF9_9HEMI|nr:unnamed protein product [Macrosiphum euphorbiae]